MFSSYDLRLPLLMQWEYPEAVERFGRQLEALGIASELEKRGALEGDLVMVDEYDFDFSPGIGGNPYVPLELLEQEAMFEESRISGGMPAGTNEQEWRPFKSGGYLDDDIEELVGFNEDGDWDLLEDAEEYDEFPDDFDDTI